MTGPTARQRHDCGGLSLPCGGDAAFTCGTIHEGYRPFESGVGEAMAGASPLCHRTP